MTAEPTEERRAARHRSPSYPGVGLADAIERARAIYLKEKMNATPVDVINLHWGYRKDSSNGGVVISALIKFGLLADQGTGASRSVHLTESARRIILDAEDRDSLVREAALAPTIHRELWERYPDGLPSRETLRRYLLVDRNFNEKVIDDFIDQFTATLEFAGLLGGDSISDEIDDMAEREGEHENDPSDSDSKARRERKPGMTTLSFQISDRLVEVAVPGGPLTKAEIAILRAYLTIQEQIAPAAPAVRSVDPFFAGINQPVTESEPA